MDPMTAAAEDPAEDPSVLRRRLLTFLRRQRDIVGLTQQKAADELEWSLSKLIRIETGAQGISVTDLKAVLALYGVADDALAKSLIAAARGSRGQSWWHPYRDIVSPQFAQYLGQEGIAASLQVFHPFLVPGLLQTEGYAAALHAVFQEPERARRIIELKMERQKRISANSALNTTFVLNEEALYRQIGGAAGMREQLQHLLRMTEASKAMLRIVPYTAGAHAGLGGPFVLLRSDETGDGMVYIESINGDQLIRDDSESIKQYESYFEQLSGLSLAPKQAKDLLAESINRLDRDSANEPVRITGD
jgi:transcriptional regulator with XRE-family HTH domain